MSRNPKPETPYTNILELLQRLNEVNSKGVDELEYIDIDKSVLRDLNNLKTLGETLDIEITYVEYFEESEIKCRVFFGTRNQSLGIKDLNASGIDYSTVVKIGHNHPSGSILPSLVDIFLALPNVNNIIFSKDGVFKYVLIKRLSDLAELIKDSVNLDDQISSDILSILGDDIYANFESLEPEYQLYVMQRLIPKLQEKGYIKYVKLNWDDSSLDDIIN